MDLDKAKIRETCTDAVFERAREYRGTNRIRRIERFDDVVTSEVQGTDLYDVTVRLVGDRAEARCTCPYAGPGECKHVVAVLLEVVRDPPEDSSERIDPVLEKTTLYGLRAFVRDALADSPHLRQRFLARFGERTESVEKYRREIEALFDQHTQDYPVVTTAIDFSHFFTLASEYRARDRSLDAATVYQALFETIDENIGRIDAAYDHYTETLQTALDGYVECVLEADGPTEDVERYSSVLEDRLSRTGVYREAFQRAIDELDAGCDSPDG